MTSGKGTAAEGIKRLIVKNHVELEENITLDEELWNHLRATGVVSAAERDRMQHDKTQNEQISSLLDFLGRRPDKDITHFCEALHSTKQNHIIADFLTPSSPNDVPSTRNIQRGIIRKKTSATSVEAGPRANDKRIMRDDIKKLLRVNREDIIDNLDLDNVVWKKLIRAKIIMAEKARSIQENYKMAEDQVGPFLDHLIRRPEDDFNKFCSILKECDQGQIVDDYLTKK